MEEEFLKSNDRTNILHKNYPKYISKIKNYIQIIINTNNKFDYRQIFNTKVIVNMFFL